MSKLEIVNPLLFKILIVDDNPNNLFTLESLLKGLDNCEIIQASSGEQALVSSLEHSIDLILLDVQMPEMDGYETAKHLKMTARTRDIPIIFVTAIFKSEEFIEHGYEIGAIDYLTKPIDDNMLLNRIMLYRTLFEREKALKAALTKLELSSEESYHDLFEGSMDALLITDLEIGFIDCNAQAVELFAASLKKQLIHTQPFELSPFSQPNGQPSKKMAQDYMQSALQKGSMQFEWQHQRFNGELFYAEILLNKANWKGKTILLASVRDISQRKQSEDKLKLSASVFQHAREGIFITDAQGNIIDTNDSVTVITGYAREEVIGKNPRILHSGKQSPEFYTDMWNTLIEKKHWHGEIWNRCKNQDIYVEKLTISAVCDNEGKVLNYVGLFTDITVAKKQQFELEHMAHYDILTNLPNRVLLADRLSHAMVTNHRQNRHLAIAFLDLDGFKAVNDTYGHDMGDQLLITMAERITKALREGDTLARIGGDEFVIVLVDLESIEDYIPVIERVLAASSESVVINQMTLNISASIGVTLSPHDSVDAEQLIRHADQAMYIAKQAGKNRFHLFDIKQDDSLKLQCETLEHIRQALYNEEFVLYYQPKVNMQKGCVIGVEALIRWQHPERGLLPPSEFLPIIEKDLLSIEVGEWVIKTALNQMVLWQAEGLELIVSVNIDALHLRQKNFSTRLKELLAMQPTIGSHYLELEVLETSMLGDLVHISTIMNDCIKLGVNFALDDFGTGYSSLTYLRRLPTNLIKIDQTFVRDALIDSDDLAIIKGVIGLAKSFNREVIAEGVETIEHGTQLLKLGCVLAQGYGIARPMPASELPNWVQNWQPDKSWES